MIHPAIADWPPIPQRILGRTGVSVSVLSFGAGPISTLMVGEDDQRQLAVVDAALQVGINWFDTAATYGGGQSERSLGAALAQLGAASRVHVATKVRLMPEDLGDIGQAVRRSFEGSLERLRLPRVTLLQLHNSVTTRRGDLATSVTPADVLGPGGIVDAFRKLKDQGLVDYLGMTGIGQPAAMREVVDSGQIDTMQVPYHLLNPSAGQEMPGDFDETNYGNIIASCARQNMGVFAIRVLAGGAMAQNPPSPHTLKTPFFPLDLYQRDVERARRLQDDLLDPKHALSQMAIRFAVEHPSIHSAIVGLGSPREILEARAAIHVDWPVEMLRKLAAAGEIPWGGPYKS